MTELKALDLFAGTGWGVACQRLGIQEFGVELMPQAVKTRDAHGMRTIFNDVWDGLDNPSLVPDYELLIGSPPCQTFSAAGKGDGVKALGDVLAALDDGAYKDAAKLRELAAVTDPKTALVLTPLAYVWRDRPRLVVLEQVPPVMPVWHAMAVVMRRLGYSVVVEILDAECYGVPQTRDRAILIGRLDGMADMPMPTHSRYYSSDSTRMDAGVLPWVSMAEALGWGTTSRPSYTLTSGGAESGGFEPFPTGARTGMAQARGEWCVNGSQDNAAHRSISQPAPTVHFGERHNDVRWVGPGPDPRLPATTVAGDPRLTSRGHHGHGEQGMTVDSTEVREAFVRVITNQNSDLGHGKKRRYSRLTSSPAPTLTGNANSYRKSTNTDLNDTRGVKVTVEEAALLQSYSPGFEFCGSDTKKYQQIGNAVPPLLAQAILSAVMLPPRERSAWDHVFAEVAG